MCSAMQWYIAVERCSHRDHPQVKVLALHALGQAAVEPDTVRQCPFAVFLLTFCCPFPVFLLSFTDWLPVVQAVVDALVVATELGATVSLHCVSAVFHCLSAVFPPPLHCVSAVFSLPVCCPPTAFALSLHCLCGEDSALALRFHCLRDSASAFHCGSQVSQSWPSMPGEPTAMIAIGETVILLTLSLQLYQKT